MSDFESVKKLTEQYLARLQEDLTAVLEDLDQREQEVQKARASLALLEQTKEELKKQVEELETERQIIEKEKIAIRTTRAEAERLKASWQEKSERVQRMLIE